MIFLIIAESALELVPNNLQSHPSVLSQSQKIGKRPSNILLDNSWHFAAMKGIENEIKRGRPDLVHFSILEATSIPLYATNKIKIFVHTITDKVITIGENVHIPKSYHRFTGLIEKLFQEKTISSNNQELLSIKDQTFGELVDEINPTKIIGLSTTGKLTSLENLGKNLPENCCIVIGGFQKGHFSELIRSRFNDVYSIEKTSLEAHVVVARMLYEYEKTIFM